MWNRMYLLITGCFSVLVPLFKIWLPVTGYTREITYFMAPVFFKGENQFNMPVSFSMPAPEIIYFAVVSILLLKFIVRLIQVFLLTKTNESIELKGQKIVVIEKECAPFSFLNTIFLTKDQISDASVDKIIAHEEMHVHQFHSIDMIFFEFIKIIQWFNPFAWKFKKEIEAQHEFSADSGLLSGGIDINEYKNVLVAYSLGVGGSTITNNFNSLLKRRLEMLSIKKSNMFGKVKLFFTLPLMVLLIMLVGIVNGSISFASGTQQNDQKEQIMIQCDEMPLFHGGTEGLFKFMTDNIVYPENAKKSGIKGKVFVGFVVEKDGSVSNVEILKGVGSGLDEEAVRVIKLMPKWQPGKDKGKLVRVKIAVPIVFSLD
jgi:TonB family protein